ncbi:MAG: zinc ribbon domain-containing protein [Anaerolineales bacterium]|nr:zinc ribbon domain-containing protein [Anaerolineales bacterium]
MPIYEYTCSECGKRFDTLRSMSAADDPIPCPDCGSGQTKRALSLFCARGESGLVAGGGGSSCGTCSGGSCASCGG